MNTTNLNHEKNLKCLEGSFAVEGIELSKQTRENLRNLSNKKTSYKELIGQIKNKYSKRG